MKTIIIRAAGVFLLFTIACGVLYTAFITIAAQLIFKAQANGSIINVENKAYGSELVGQSFSDNTHLWGRPVSLDVSTYKDENGKPLAYAAPSNLSPASAEYEQLIAKRVSGIKAAHPEKGDFPIPVELVTESASGLDPHISPAAAQYQVERLAAANNITSEQVQAIISKCTSGRLLGFIGEETVNVLRVNLMLDGIIAA